MDGCTAYQARATEIVQLVYQRLQIVIGDVSQTAAVLDSYPLDVLLEPIMHTTL